MHILVVNSGSSSLKFSIFESVSQNEPQAVLDGEVSGIGGKQASLELRPTSETNAKTANVVAENSTEAIHLVLDELFKPGIPVLDAVGYRVVHPGPKLDRHQRITEEVLTALEAAVAFAPLHDPDAIRLIREAMTRFPDIPHYACFDTVFHQTMPTTATTYPIPFDFREHGVRRYGFHGLSCESVVRQMRKKLSLQEFPEYLIIAHLGSGCSVTALRNGESIDTTMGLTPTGGVVMGSRPGDLDPGLIFYLLRQPGATIDSVEHMLNHDAGLKALFGINDMRKLREAKGDLKAWLAITVFTDSVRRAIGGMAAVHSVDAIVFTGGIGEHDPLTRSDIATGLWGAQPVLAAAPFDHGGLKQASSPDSAVPVYVVPAQEDLVIAIHVARMSASK